MRVSALPTNEGEKIVIRLLDYSSSLNGLDTLGFTPNNLKKVERLLDIPNGIILVTGATGSGKSVGVHNIILSILYKARPDEVKFMLIDPKRVEMTAYKEIPHLYNPCCMADDADVITRPNEASDALKK